MDLFMRLKSAFRTHPPRSGASLPFWYVSSVFAYQPWLAGFQNLRRNQPYRGSATLAGPRGLAWVLAMVSTCHRDDDIESSPSSAVAPSPKNHLRG